MRLYTGKGDNGTTKVFDCDQRMSKSSAVAEALGVLDEVNSYLGVCKTNSDAPTTVCNDIVLATSLHEIQNDLFIIQAEVAGAKKEISAERVAWLEQMIETIEKELPEINSFFVSGGTLLSAQLDFARTLVRRAERRVVAVSEEGVQKVGNDTLAYLNRASTALYAFVRLVNQQGGVAEIVPDYA